MDQSSKKSLFLLITISLLFSVITGYYQYLSTPTNEGFLMIVPIWIAVAIPLFLINIFINSVARNLFKLPKLPNKFLLIPIVLTVISSNFFLFKAVLQLGLLSARYLFVNPSISIIDEKIVAVDRAGNSSWGSSKFEYKYVLQVQDIPDKYLGSMTYNVSLKDGNKHDYNYVAKKWTGNEDMFLTESKQTIYGSVDINFATRPQKDNVYIEIALNSNDGIFKKLYTKSKIDNWEHYYDEHIKFIKMYFPE